MKKIYAFYESGLIKLAKQYHAHEAVNENDFQAS